MTEEQHLKTKRKVMHVKKKALIKYIVALLLLVILLIALWFCDFSKQYVNREEIIGNVGENGSFIAPSDEISSMEIMCLDKNYFGSLSVTPLNFLLSITDKNGNMVWSAETENCFIDANNYTEIDKELFTTDDVFPISLKKGECYTFACSVQNENNVKITDISVALYGDEIQMPGSLYIIVSSLLSVAFSLILLMLYHVNYCEKKDGIVRTAFMLSMLLICITSILILPTFSVDYEENDFAKSYSLSNEILGREVADESGYVIVDDNQIRNIGEISKQSLYRFWYCNTDKIIEGDINTSSLYRLNNEPKAGYLLPAIGISIARILKLPYQMVFISGRITNLFIWLIVLSVILRLSGDKFRFMYLLFFNPVVITTITSYSPISEIISLCVLTFSLILEYRSKEACRSKKNLFVLLILFETMILINPIMVVMGILLLVVPVDDRLIVFKKKCFCFVTLSGLALFLVRILLYGFNNVFPWISRPFFNQVYYIANTLFKNFNTYFDELFGIKYFARISVPTGMIYLLLICSVIFIKCMDKKNTEVVIKEKPRKGKILIFTSVLFVILVLAVHDTYTYNTGGTVIYKINGITFFPLVLVALYARCDYAEYSPKIKKASIALTFLSIIILIYRYESYFA